MAFTDSYPTNLPNGDESPTTIDDLILATRKGLQQRLDVDHYFTIDASNLVDDVDHVGNHTKVTLDAPITTPTPLAGGETILYTKDADAKAELHFVDEDSDEIQITTGGKLNLTGTYDLEMNLSNTANAFCAASILCTAVGILNLPTMTTDTTEGNLRYNTDDDVVQFRDSDSWETLAKLATLATFSQMEVYTYVGDGEDTQEIDFQTSFEADVVLILPHTGNTGYGSWLKTDAMGANAYGFSGDGGYDTDRIISLDADGFTVGKSDKINELGVTYSYIALKIGT